MLCYGLLKRHNKIKGFISCRFHGSTVPRFHEHSHGLAMEPQRFCRRAVGEINACLFHQ